jgi:ATP-binding cassette, subfamily C (CFTR/MRP), member 1
MAFLYYIVSVYYRRSSVETKRLDSLLRSILYGSYSGKFLVCNDLLSDRFRILETLTGVSTIRAYREQAGRFFFFLIFDSYMIQTRCIREAEQGLDMENRAYLMTVSIQRWLAVRLDFFGNILVLGIALFAAGFRTTVNPSKIGVVLSYTLGSRFMHNL